MSNRVLISTLPPFVGGVTEMTRLVAGWLNRRGYDPVIAYYEPYSVTPRLSVPVLKLLVNQVAGEKRLAFGKYEAHALGCWFPELEFTHYLPTSLWRSLVESCDFHISVSGSCLAATPYTLSGRPFWAWVATPWEEDRIDRVKTFPWYRRWLDAAINSHIVRRLERKILGSGTIVALSQYTRDTLNRITSDLPVRHVMPMAVDTTHFRPRADQGSSVKVGFIGRYDDPRKNVALLLDSLVWCRRHGHPVKALIAGADSQSKIMRMIGERDLQEIVELHGIVNRNKVAGMLGELSAFVVPSHQEGLCIAALEAMACGVPVVSTRCGGPEEFVRDDETGFLVDSTPADVGRRILDIVCSKNLQQTLGAGARGLIEREYSEQKTESIFWSSFNEVFPLASAA